MARPPLRPGNPHPLSHPATSATNANAPKASQNAGVRHMQANQTAATDQPQSLDYFVIYELFVTSVTALVTFFMVRTCGLIALNYRTLILKAVESDEQRNRNNATTLHWLVNVHVQWFSSGTVLVSTSTEQSRTLRCLDSISDSDQKCLVGHCVRVAPNAMLARVSSFEDPLESTVTDAKDDVRRGAKKKRIASLEHNIGRWKSAVERWLSWRGYSLHGLDQPAAWVRIRLGHVVQVPIVSPGSSTLDRDILWPRALCFVSCFTHPGPLFTEAYGVPSPPSFDVDLKWFEGEGSHGFRDPIDVAHDWFVGKLERDKSLDARRKAKKAEEDAMRRKDEPTGLFPSSPFTTRSGAYGDLQAVGGVYPTPPDGVAPGAGFSSTDTASMSGVATNVILASGGNNPSINLSAPQDHPSHDEQQHPATSPAFPAMERFQTSGETDDLFEDAEGDGYAGDGVEDADFDFFDGPDGEDVDMADAPSMPQDDTQLPAQNGQRISTEVASVPSVKEEMSDPLSALEKALSIPLEPVKDQVQNTGAAQQPSKDVPPSQVPSDTTASQLATESPRDPPKSKEPTPPLSPGIIANALQPSPTSRSTVQKSTSTLADHAESAFHSLDFGRRMSLVDAKYQDGQFGRVKQDSEIDNGRTSSSAHPTRIKSLRDLPLLSNLRYAVGVATTSKAPKILSLARDVSDDSDSDTESVTSDASVAQAQTVADDRPPPFLGRLVIPTKRKIPTEGHGTPLSVTSFADSFGGDWQEYNGLQLEEASLTLFEPNTGDWAMANLPPPTERRSAGTRYAIPSLPRSLVQLPDTPTSQPDFEMDFPDEKPFSGKENIFITQIITDQIISATLDLLNENDDSVSTSIDKSSTESRWQAMLKDLFPKAAECSLSGLIAIHDVFPDLSSQAKGQQRPPPRKPNEGNAVPGNHMYQMNPPFIRVRRAETHWDLLPPSIAFWEPLGLAPVSPAKNVVAFCVYPDSDPLRPILDRFLLNLQLAYDTCKLGSHARVETVQEFEGGLVPVNLESHISSKGAFKALRDTCVQLGKLLAIQHAQIGEQQDTKVDAFVVYMVDPFGSPAALWELCSAFWALFQAYGQGPLGRPDAVQRPDVVLQIIPIKYLASFDNPVILEASTYVNLAREVYDRCPPSALSTDKTPLSIYKAPAFQLEESLPRNIQFKLMAEPPQDLLRENSYMHLAYAISLDGAWVTAAWTDSCGKSQAVVSYHLGTRVFGEVAKEIWQTTIELLQSRRVQWRVCIAKAGALDREELETWVLLITCPTQVNLFLTLLTVVEDSPYQFTPATSNTSNSSASQAVNTPGSTPQPSVSPDPAAGLTPAATPCADNAPDLTADPEARLVDVTDETWGIILAHRLHNSHSTNQFNPALISGLLVKRGETHSTSNSIHHHIPDPSPGPITIAVNIIWIGAVGSTRAATSPFPPASDGVSPGGAYPAAAAGSSSAGPSPSPHQERSTSSLMWTPTLQTRSTAENLLKEVLGQFRALGLLAKLRGMRGTKHGSLPWHVVAAKRGVEGLSRVTAGS